MSSQMIDLTREPMASAAVCALATAAIQPMAMASLCAAEAPNAAAATGPVALRFQPDALSRADGHDVATKRSVAHALAAVLGLGIATDGDASAPAADSTDAQAAAPHYLVPSDTLLSLDAARALGLRGPQDLFGGVVPWPFVATKVITHPLVRADAEAPEGWSNAFGEQVRGVVLPGLSVFTLADARAAGKRLLGNGSVRVKEPGGVGGSGQTVVSDATQLDTVLSRSTPEQLRREGLVLERNLHRVTTCSIGQVRAGRWLISYCGTQGLTRNHQGHEVYGGSRLQVVRGGYEDLLRLPMSREWRTAVEQAMVYDRAAMACFAGMYASRCNYDVAQGFDEGGRWRSGVLEQSWRIGGASGAEIAALEAFDADPALKVVHTSTQEVYLEDGARPRLSASARVHYDGTDAHVGRLIKFAQVDTDGDV